jgi:hypothetical protein
MSREFLTEPLHLSAWQHGLDVSPPLLAERERERGEREEREREREREERETAGSEIVAEGLIP